MRNPNHYGSITKMSGQRRKPYRVREGTTGRQKTIGYAATREEALKMLADYNSEYWNVDAVNITFEDLYELWLKRRADKLRINHRRSLMTAYGYCGKLYKEKYRQIKAYQMQNVVDECHLSHSSKANIRTLLMHLDRYALELDVIVKMNYMLVDAGETPDTTKVVFTEDEIEKIWNSQDSWIKNCTLILLYTGFRIMEFLTMRDDQVDLENWTLTGGIKTKAGRNRTVPIHSRIRGIVEETMDNGYLAGMKISDSTFRNKWNEYMASLEMKHTPHECRHTLRSRLDSAGANRVCIDRIMGHKSFGVGESVYTHKTVEELREAIEMIE